MVRPATKTEFYVILSQAYSVDEPKIVDYSAAPLTRALKPHERVVKVVLEFPKDYFAPKIDTAYLTAPSPLPYAVGGYIAPPVKEDSHKAFSDAPLHNHPEDAKYYPPNEYPGEPAVWCKECKKYVMW